jgi:ankyrin repeat protein
LLCSSLLAPLSSPLFAAIHGNHLSAVRALVDAGADVFAARRDGVTAIHMCAKFGSVEVLEVLLQSPPFSRTTLAAAAASATDAVDAAAVVAVTPAALEMESAAVTTSTAATLRRGRGLMAGDAVTRATESPPSNTPSDDDLNAGGVRGVRGVGGRGAGSGVVPVPRPELDCETRVHGVSPLLLATLHGRAGIVELLLRAGAARDAGSTIRRVLGDDR